MSQPQAEIQKSVQGAAKEKGSETVEHKMPQLQGGSRAGMVLTWSPQSSSASHRAAGRTASGCPAAPGCSVQEDKAWFQPSPVTTAIGQCWLLAEALIWVNHRGSVAAQHSLRSLRGC